MISLLLLLLTAPLQGQLNHALDLFESGRPNEALEQYREVALAHGESGELLYNLATCCLELDEQAWAVYYFCKAGNWERANLVRADLGLAPLARSLSFRAETLLLPLLIASLVALLVGTVAIWTGRLRRTASSLLLLLGLVYGGALWLHLFSSSEAIVIRSSAVRRADERVAIAPAGTLVKVVRFGDEVEIVTEDGKRGTIASGTLQLL